MAQIDVFAKCKAAGTTTTKLPSLSMLSLTDANKNWGSSPHIKSSESKQLNQIPPEQNTPRGPTHNLPHEIITAIIQFVPSTSLHECALVSRRWNNVTTPIMYGNPFLPTVTSISAFLSHIEQTKAADRLDGLFVDHLHWNYHALTRAVTFTRVMPPPPSSEDSTDGVSISKRQSMNEDIVKTQSSLFRLLVTDRTNPDWSFIHPILLRLVKACERLEEGHEYLHDNSAKHKKKQIPRRRNTNGTSTGQWHTVTTTGLTDEQPPTAPGPSVSQPIQSNSSTLESVSASSTSLPSLSTTPNSRSRTPVESLMDPDRLLSNLIKLCRRVIGLCDTFGVAPETIVDSLLLFLGLLESFEKPVWQLGLLSEESFKEIKKCVFDKLRGILNAISTSILIEVQYVTVSSQKLLDSYCMLYYRALAHANAMNLGVVLDILQLSFNSSLCKSAQHNKIRNASREFTASSKQDPDSPTYHRPATKPAHKILQALTLMFHRNLFNFPRNNTPDGVALDIPPTTTIHPDIPPTTPLNPTEQSNQQQQDFDTLGGLLTSRTSLREGLMSFVPGSMNSETAEFIQEILADTSDLETQLTTTSLQDQSGSNTNGARDFEEALEVAKCVRWMKEVVRWQRAGRQMEPVKDLLRKSMARIDRLRGVQRRYGLYFMD
ncbi:hypothetical protein HDU79_010555 [Rhizoclosmatium sp. JEL0117]|nr:hypothetical protein HDU79_010555 [Rhizoclosmatium sp. JEL0117]